MDDCQEYLELISCMVDSELDDEQQARLCTHISQCPSCKKVYDAFAFISQDLSTDFAEPPELLAKGIMFKISCGQKKKTKHSVLWIRYGAVAACFALIVLGAAKVGVLDNLFSSKKSASLETRSAAEPAEYSFDATGEVSADNFQYSEAVGQLLEGIGGSADKKFGEGEASLFAAPLPDNSASLFNMPVDKTLIAVKELFADVTEIRFYEGLYSNKTGIESTNKLLVTITDETELKTLSDALMAKASEPELNMKLPQPAIPNEAPRLSLLLLKMTDETCIVKEKLLSVYTVDGQIMCAVYEFGENHEILPDPMFYKSVTNTDAFDKIIAKIKLAHSIL